MYNVILLFYGFILGQFTFFWSYEKKLYHRIFRKKSRKALIFSAPSGSGKSTIVQQLLKNRNDIKFSISATTRSPRANEEHGKHYYFISQQEFEEKIKNNEFLEYEQVYQGIYYGTLNVELEKIWKDKCHVIFDVDVEGGKKIKSLLKENALAVFVKVKDIETLETRLKNRNTETEETLNLRISKAKQELAYEKYFDVTILNEDLNEAVKETIQKVNIFLKK